ncbi:MAG: ABC-2 family transporter protein [Caulobacteraceae bacterium]
MNAARLLGRYFMTSIRAQLQYPMSTLTLILGQLVITVAEAVGTWALFDRFGTLRGWALADICVFYGTANVTFAFTETICRGFDVFGGDFVRNGAFDRVLLRPRSAVLQVIGHEFRLSRFGRLVQGLTILILASTLFGFAWTPAALGLVLWAIIGGIALFTGLYLLQATLSFWTVDGLEIANLFTHGSMTAGQYPMNIYAAWFRRFLTFVVPLACVAYYPIVAALGRDDPGGAPAWILPFAPLAGFAFLGASFIAWRFGVGKYTSTGS